jgi:hypothetical protein
MAAPDFFFAVNAIFRHLHDRHGKDALVRYWRDLGKNYYRSRWQRWRDGGVDVIANDWQKYFAREPGADVTVAAAGDAVDLHVRRSGDQASARSRPGDRAVFLRTL